MRKVKNDDFDLVNLPKECQDPEINEKDFELAQADGSVHEQKFQTKPTTFFKDSMKRFAKNKSSVVAAYILGILILLAIIVPIASPYDVSGASDTALYNLEPKLFSSGTGFWDGTVKKTHIPVDTSKSEDPDDWMPDPTIYREDGISNKVIEPEQYTSDANAYGRQGYVQIGYYGTYGLENADLSSPDISTLGDDKFTLDLSVTSLVLTKFDTVDADKIKYYAESDPTSPQLPSTLLPEGFELGKAVLEFVYTLDALEYRIPLTDNKIVHGIGNGLSGEEAAVDINQKINDYFVDAGETPITVFDSCYFNVRVTGDEVSDKSYCSLIKNLVITSTGTNQKANNYFSKKTIDDNISIPGISFTDATEMLIRTTELTFGLTKYKTIGYWSVSDLTRYTKAVHMSRCTYASFTYDGYKGALGKRNMNLSKNEIELYWEYDWLDYNIDIEWNQTTLKYEVVEDTFFCEILNAARCPLIEPFEYDDVYVSQTPGPGGEFIYSVNADVTYYKYLGYEKMPSFLFGTDKSGKDMFKYVFEGLRNSLLLGLFTFIICFVFGLIWGSISGYFGGTVDLIMERVTDILSGLPWIVIMTLVVLKANESSFWTLALALCLTGWIGTASLTRTQFYRFRGREYVLASRTLGASHGRLIAKHILPNAMGTIITSSVLMIPAIIFQEATISYLGLGFKNLSSLGVILSNNQNQLTNHPYQLIFPSVVIALVMISFNLFGNGLRDAINPSLKGEDE